MSGLTEEDIRRQWPLHHLVWQDEHRALTMLLEAKEHDREQKDPRGRSPLHLAVTLGRVKCAEVLLANGANTLAHNRHRWTVLNEAVSIGNPEMLGLVLRWRDQQYAMARSQDIPLLLERLQATPDFYIEMKWEFSSWVPLVSRMCPSDTYKIWKKGTTVRVDTTLIGFQQYSWLRGALSFIFRGSARGAHVSEINHDKGTVVEEEFRIVEPDPVQTLMAQEMGVLHRMNSPIVSTIVDTDSVAFQRQKSGIWGFRSDKVENINGYAAKVFAATGLDIVTRTRVEHLPAEERKKHQTVSPLQDFLGTAHNDAPPLEQAAGVPTPAPPEPPTDVPELSMEEYFTAPPSPKENDAIGRPIEVTARVQKLKATVWLAEQFPLSLQEQIMPIIELMALNNAHFAKLKDFITLQMPAGFPVKFEIPLFHVMAAKVTFGNINGHHRPVPHVTLSQERVPVRSVTALTPSHPHASPLEGAVEVGGMKHRRGASAGADVRVGEVEREAVESSVDAPVDAVVRVVEGPCDTVEQEVCQIADDCFTIPSGYRQMRRGRGVADEEEELLQLAIRQSLMDQGGDGGGGGEGGGGGGREGGGGGGGEDGGMGDGGEQLTLGEALKDTTVRDANDPGMQSAIRASLGMEPLEPSPAHHQPTSAPPIDDDLALALILSRDQADEGVMLRQREDEELERVLRLSLEEK